MEVLKKHAVKLQIGSIVTVILFVITSVWWVGSIKADYDQQFITVQNQYEHCDKWYESLQERQDELIEKNQEHEVVIMEIRTKLANIEAMLLDIKRGI